MYQINVFEISEKPWKCPLWSFQIQTWYLLQNLEKYEQCAGNQRKSTTTIGMVFSLQILFRHDCQMFPVLQSLGGDIFHLWLSFHNTKTNWWIHCSAHPMKAKHQSALANYNLALLYIHLLIHPYASTINWVPIIS